jgi:hypothetical protein
VTDPNLPDQPQPGSAVPPPPPPPPAAPSEPTAPAAPSYGAPQPAAPPPPAAPGYTAPAYAAAPASATPILSILSLIGGVLGILSSWAFFGLLFSIAAIVLGFIGKNKEPAAKGMWLTGIILGFVGIAIGLIVVIFTIVAFIALASYGSAYTY